MLFLLLELHSFCQRRETAKLHEFLMGLYSEFYAQLRTNILSTEPLPTLDRAYHLAVQDERVRQSLSSAVPSGPTEALGFSVQARTSAGRGSRLSCPKCHKNGHDASSCWAHLTCSHCHKRAMVRLIAMIFMGTLKNSLRVGRVKAVVFL